jgi:hypothetical protein
MKLGTSFVLFAPMPSRNEMHDVSFVSGNVKLWKEGKILVIHDILKGYTYIFIRFHGSVGVIRRMYTS